MRPDRVVKPDWCNASDPATLDDAVEKLRKVVPEKGTSLLEAFRSIDTLLPVPDNVILLTDGLPTRGSSPPRGTTVTARQRLKLFDCC